MLTNRAEFLRAVERRLVGTTEDEPAAVLLVNIDRFEAINEHLGAAAGSHALEDIGKRLQARVRPTDVLARLRGDEFAVLLGVPSSQADATMLAEHVGDALRPPRRTNCKALHRPALPPESRVASSRLERPAGVGDALLAGMR